MRFLLDTNAIIQMMRGDPVVIGRLLDHDPAEFGLSAIVLSELRYGASKSARASENHARLDAIRFEIVPFDAQDAATAGAIRAILERAGQIIGPYDIQIAAQAFCRDLTLVTHNTREFTRVDGLRVEDWQA